MMDKEVIEFQDSVNNLSIYNDTLLKLNEYYKSHNRNDLIELSFQQVKWLDALSIPNLMIIGTILKLFHKKSIPLYLPYDLRLVNFLRCSNFFEISDLPFLNLFDYNEELVNQSGFFIDKEYRDKHKIHYYKPDLSYYNILEEEQQQIKRSEVYQAVRYGIVPNQYQEILQDQELLNNEEMNILLDVFSEIICNSILYSQSISYSFLQTGKFGSSIAISDAGIGFKQSFEKKLGFKNEILEKYKTKLDTKLFEDFLYIIEILNYSMKQQRRNLWSLKNIIVNNGGILRIHYNSTQIIFNSSRCSGCRKNAESCIECFLNKFYSDKKISSLRIFPVNLRGIHIEVELRSGTVSKHVNFFTE